MTGENRIEELRLRAWDYSLHAEGTRDIFSRRYRSLRRRTIFRDWLGFGVPILIGAAATTEWLDAASQYRHLVFVALGVAGVGQLLFALWSALSRWDDEVAYCTRAMRDSYELKEAWTRIGRADVDDIPLEYRLRMEQQKLIDSHDIQRNISDRELQLGMRAGLILLQRKCSGCGNPPVSRKPPLISNQKKCIICGGN